MSEAGILPASFVFTSCRISHSHGPPWECRKAKFSGLSAKAIAEKIGTSPTNVMNLIKRGSHTSQFSEPIDTILREAVPEYNTQLNELLEPDFSEDLYVDIGNVLLSQARLLRDPRRPVEFKMKIIGTIISQLKSFRDTPTG